MDGKLGILTNSQNQNAKIEKIYTNRIKQEFKKGNIVLITGFQGIDMNENITTLGRGGSDTTAVAIASALKAKHCYIFSDVDGIYSTDPKKIQIAKKIETLSYQEMFEIADEGAKVLHNRCIEIGDRYNISIITQSTFNNSIGSTIENKLEYSGVKSIVKNDDLIYVNIKNNNPHLFKNLYNKFIHNDIWPRNIINNENSNIKFLINKKEFDKLEDITKDIKISFKNVSKISIVGHGITNTSEIMKIITKIIYENNLSLYTLDVSQTKIGIVFDNVLDDKILDILHSQLIK